MSGVINSPAAAGGPGVNEPMSNPVLEAAEQKIESQLTPDNQQSYMKIVVAGMAAALGGGPQGLMASLLKSPDPVRDAARGAVALVLVLRRDAHGVMPLKAMVPAAMTLMLRALDFVNRTGIAPVGTPELVRATHIFANEIFGHFGITAPMLANATARVHAITQDPVAMEMINRKAGVVQAPGASSATPVPGGQ
jgi:hypothetical protein